MQFTCQLSHVLTLLLMTAFAGCGSSSNNPASVTGKVTYDGQPAVGGRVMFVSEGQASEVFIGLLDQQGQYELKMTEGISGAQPGKYKVAVIIDDATQMDEQGNSIRDPNAISIPQKYQNADNSGLTAEIKEGKNVIDFALAAE